MKSLALPPALALIAAFALTLGFAVIAAPVFADAPLIEAVDAQENGGRWSFSVALSHPDSGWEHYADGWEIVDAEGNVLGHRTLAHPHVNEQPFTRSLSGVEIPDTLTQVFVRAHCLVDGWGAQMFAVNLQR